MTRAEEVAVKIARLHGLLEKKGWDGVLLTKTGNFAWLTAGGDNHVVSSMEPGIASLLVTTEGKFLLTDNIEQPRLAAEELDALGFRPVLAKWWQGGLEAAIAQKTAGLKIGSDVPMRGLRYSENDIAPLRWPLLPSEVARYRKVAQDCAAAMNEVCRNDVKPGVTEFEVAADISEELLDRGIDPVVVLIAADDRIKQFRHPIPTFNKVKKYCMVVLCGERQGLIVSMTRLVHFGSLSRDLMRRHQAVATIDARVIAATRPGKTAGDMFKVIRRAYKEVGFPNEWQLHHQGGAMGYATRDWKAHDPDDKTPIVVNQAFGWNPSITGTKSEDTVIAGAKRPEIISAIAGWPMVEIETEVGVIKRPDVLVV